MKTITIIGLGNLGSALALVLLENGHKVTAFEHNKNVVQEINQKHTNSQFLLGIIIYSGSGSYNLPALSEKKHVRMKTNNFL